MPLDVKVLMYLYFSEKETLLSQQYTYICERILYDSKDISAEDLISMYTLKVQIAFLKKIDKELRELF